MTTFNGFQLLICIGCLAVAAWLALRDIDSQKVDGYDDVERAADPRRFNGERP